MLYCLSLFNCVKFNCVDETKVKKINLQKHNCDWIYAPSKAEQYGLKIYVTVSFFFFFLPFSVIVLFRSIVILIEMAHLNAYSGAAIPLL